MYTAINFRTKKDLIEAVAAGRKVNVYQPNSDLFESYKKPTDGEIALEGPHFPASHTWYASAVIKNGHIVKVT
jgi:hypothetical protein